MKLIQGTDTKVTKIIPPLGSNNFAAIGVILFTDGSQQRLPEVYGETRNEAEAKARIALDSYIATST